MTSRPHSRRSADEWAEAIRDATELWHYPPLNDLLDELTDELRSTQEQHEAVTRDRDAALGQVDELDEKVRGLSEQNEFHKGEVAFLSEKVDGLQEQFGALHEAATQAWALMPSDHQAAEVLADALLAVANASSPASRRHGRDCPCTPCQAEDWDAIDAGIAARLPATNHPAFLEREVGGYPPVMDDLLEEPAPASSPEPGMLYHQDGTPYMHVADYMESRGDPPRLRYPPESDPAKERQ